LTRFSHPAYGLERFVKYFFTNSLNLLLRIETPFAISGYFSICLLLFFECIFALIKDTLKSLGIVCNTKVGVSFFLYRIISVLYPNSSTFFIVARTWSWLPKFFVS